MVVVALAALHLAALSCLSHAPMPYRAETTALLALAAACPIILGTAWMLSGVRLRSSARWLELPIAGVFVVVSVTLVGIVAGLTVANPIAGLLTGALLVALLAYLTTWV
jgi:hypothetical protein